MSERDNHKHFFVNCDYSFSVFAKDFYLYYHWIKDKPFLSLVYDHINSNTIEVLLISNVISNKTLFFFQAW